MVKKMTKKLGKTIKKAFTTAKDFSVDLSVEGIKEFVDFSQGFNIASLSVGKKGQRITVTKNVSAQAKAPAVSAAPVKAVEPPKEYIKSPYVGSFHPVKGVAVGSKVKKGANVASVFSMKMEHVIKAPKDCEIKEILVKTNTPVDYNKPLIVIG